MADKYEDWNVSDYESTDDYVDKKKKKVNFDSIDDLKLALQMTQDRLFLKEEELHQAKEKILILKSAINKLLNEKNINKEIKKDIFLDKFYS